MITLAQSEALPEYSILSAVLVVTLGLILVFMGSRLVGNAAKKHLTPHLALIARKAVFYVGFVLVISTGLIQMNVNLTAVLGAAGIMTVAIGFAAQTSLSNLISGMFLLGERPFQVGDLIIVSGTRGTVVSIDLLSVKLRTPDNLFIRMPNESIIKSQVTNVSRFPIRRMDIKIGVAYKENAGRVMQLLREIADANPHSLDEPEPLIIFQDFGSSSLDFLLGVWFEKNNFLKLKNSIMQEIKAQFDAEGIEIAFPHLTVYAGTDSPSFPLEIRRAPTEEASQSGSTQPGKTPESTLRSDPIG